MVDLALPFIIIIMYVSQDGIQPMWEDPRNRNGGRWLLSFDRRRDEKRLDNCWMETVSISRVQVCLYIHS